MAYFNQGNRTGGGGRKFGGGGRSFGGGRGGFGGDRPAPQMHHTTCSDCGDSCEVPFKPNGKKPVLCNNCFKGADRAEFGGNQRFDRGDDRGGFSKKGFGERSDARRSLYDAVCADCGNECEVPFKPNGSKPVYCNDCFGAHTEGDLPRRDTRESRGDRPERSEKRAPKSESAHFGSDYSEQFEILNAKVDRLLKIVVTLAGEKGGLKAAAEAMESVDEVVTESAPAKKTKKPRKAKKVVEVDEE